MCMCVWARGQTAMHMSAHRHALLYFALQPFLGVFFMLIYHFPQLLSFLLSPLRTPASIVQETQCDLQC